MTAPRGRGGRRRRRPRRAGARLYEREQRRAERLSLIARVGQIITSGLELDDLLQRAADAVHELLGYENVDIPLVDPADGGTLVLRARGGMYKRHITWEDRLPTSAGIMGAAVRERRVQLVNDIARDPRYVRPPLAVVVARAELAIPILLGDQVLGVLNLESEHPFDEEDAASLQIVADHLAVAIRNARLYESAQTLAILQERQRLARDLHDSTTQLLFSVSLLAQSLVPAWRSDPAEGERRAERLVQLSRSALMKMRTLVAELMLEEPAPQAAAPAGAAEPAVGRERLRERLLSYAGEICSDGPALELDLDGYTPLPPAREDAVYRIAQEALNNAVKHAHASRVLVRLRVARGRVHLVVQDDGVGFRGRQSGRKAGEGGHGGLGLLGMRQRVEAVGGLLLVSTGRGEGTRVEAILPVEGTA